MSLPDTHGRLLWPVGVPRASYTRYSGRQFASNTADVVEGLVREVKLLIGKGTSWQFAISSDRAVRRNDGLPAGSGPNPRDPGVALYWRMNGETYVIACDHYDTDTANMRAIALTIDALRGIERWGTTRSTAQAFAGFKALPEPTWRTVLGPCATLEAAKYAYRELAKQRHPDVEGGSTEAMAELNEAYAAAETHFTT